MWPLDAFHQVKNMTVKEELRGIYSALQDVYLVTNKVDTRYIAAARGG